MNNNLKKLIVFVLMIVGGATFIVFGAISLKEIRTYKPVDAVVAHIQRDWTPNGDGTDTEEIRIIVTYTVDGTEYTEELMNTKTNLQKGDEITVLYNPADPTQVSGATKGIAAVQLAFGAVLALAGLGSIAVFFIRGR